MKKILLVVVAMVATLNMSAKIVDMTCAKAAAEAAKMDDKKPGTDSVRVTGYVTNTDGRISKGQQKCSMDDSKGTTQTFVCYFGNLPKDVVDENKPLNVGDKIAVSGFLMRYGTTLQMKNGDIEILERAVVSYDTISATICEAIDEGNALVDGEQTEDFFEVTDVVVSIKKTNLTYHYFDFYYACDDSTSLQGYNVNIKNLPDSVFPEVGDTVRTIGRLKKYGTEVEIIGNCWLVGKGHVVVDTIAATVAEAVTVGQGLKSGFTSIDVYEVTGYVDSIVSGYDTTYHNMSFYMCDDMATPRYDFEAYRATISQSVPVGTKVVITGHLKNYTQDAVTTIEIANGTCEILEIPEGVEDIVMETLRAQKCLIDGTLYIARDGVLYTTMGQIVR